jgi:HTH-type transcriptional regulator, competence development regulator
MGNDSEKTKFHEYTKEPEVFGIHIKKLRESSNLSLKDIENMSGISQDYLGHLENGERNIPSHSDIEKLAKIYHVDISTLLSIADTKVPDED